MKSNEHRENQRELYSSLKFNKKTTIEEYREKIEECIKYLNEAYNKLTAIAEIPVYYYMDSSMESNTDQERYVIGHLDPLKIIKKTSSENPKIGMLDMNSEKHLIYLTNIIFYDNFNKTLPPGMDEETEVIIKVKPNKDIKPKNIYIIIEKNDFDVNVLKIDLIKN